MAQTPFVVIPFVPPTSNHLYSTGRGGKRFLSKEGDAFKKKTISHIQQEKLAAIGELSELMKKDPLAIFIVQYVFFFEEDEILNTSFGSSKKGAASTRYKRMDVENRIKLVADAFSKAIGIDDSLFFHGGHSKCSARLVGGVPQVHVFFEPADPRGFGL